MLTNKSIISNSYLFFEVLISLYVRILEFLNKNFVYKNILIYKQIKLKKKVYEHIYKRINVINMPTALMYNVLTLYLVITYYLFYVGMRVRRIKFFFLGGGGSCYTIPAVSHWPLILPNVVTNFQYSSYTNKYICEKCKNTRKKPLTC